MEKHLLVSQPRALGISWIFIRSDLRVAAETQKKIEFRFQSLHDKLAAVGVALFRKDADPQEFELREKYLRRISWTRVELERALGVAREVGRAVARVEGWRRWWVVRMWRKESGRPMEDMEIVRRWAKCAGMRALGWGWLVEEAETLGREVEVFLGLCWERGKG